MKNVWNCLKITENDFRSLIMFLEHTTLSQHEQPPREKATRIGQMSIDIAARAAPALDVRHVTTTSYARIGSSAAMELPKTLTGDLSSTTAKLLRCPANSDSTTTQSLKSYSPPCYP